MYDLCFDCLVDVQASNPGRMASINTNMKDYVKRMVIEYRELSGKTAKLRQFLEQVDAEPALPEGMEHVDVALLREQLIYMHSYLNTLGRRLGRAGVPAPGPEANATLEERIAERPAPKVTEASIKDKIVSAEYSNPFPSTPHFTICGIKMTNGFLVTGESAPVSPENFDKKIGEELAFKDAFRKLWALEGYVLATELVRGTSADPGAYYANGKNPSNES